MVVVDVAAPSKTALEMGKVNENFRVFVRVRPLLKREEERGAVGCLKVSDVEGFPRAPPPQRIRVKDPRPAGQDKQLFAHHLFRGEFVFDRVFESDASQVRLPSHALRPGPAVRDPPSAPVLLGPGGRVCTACARVPENV